MVLRFSKTSTAALALLLLTGCLQRAAIVRQPERTRVAVAYVMDRDQGPGVQQVPEAVKEKIRAALDARNLEAREVPFETLSGQFDGIRDSKRRFAQVAALAPDAPLVLLVETRAAFFSQLNGRYRWMVYARVSAARRDAAEPATDDFDLPAFVDFDHEREAAVLGVAAPVIAERAGALFDSFLGGAAPAPPPRAKATGGDAIYFVMVDRFANGDRKNDGAIDPADPAAFHGGDLQGVIDHLDALQALGVRTVWLSPVFQMRTEKFFGFGAFHGYWTEDLTRVEPRFGDGPLLRTLSDELHRRGMRLYLDMVLNHVGPDAPLSKSKPTWFHRQGALQDWNDPVQLANRDVHGLPDLAQENAEVYRYLIDASLQWVRAVRPDGFRLDAVKHVPPAFWARYNAELRGEVKPGFTMLGELLDGDAVAIARTQAEGRFDAMFDFPLYFSLIDVFCKNASPARIASVLSQDRLYPDPDSLVTLLDNHDLPRVMSDCGGDEEKVKQALTLQLTARGTPSLTWGTEAGLAGAKEPENRGDMKFGANPRLESHIATLMAARAKVSSLTRGIPLILTVEDGLFVYARVTVTNITVIAINRRATPARLILPAELTRTSMLYDPRDLRKLEPAGLEVPAQGVALVTAEPMIGIGYVELHQRAKLLRSASGPKRAVEVVVKGAPADGVYLVGSGPELGGWNPAKGVGPLRGGRAQASLPVGAVYEYKLVHRSASAEPGWEQGENRSLFVQDGAGPLQLELTWRGS